MLGNRGLRERSGRRWRSPTLREGFTTSACAAAAAAAATRSLLNGGLHVAQIEIVLPAERQVTFEVARCDAEPGRVTCGIIKDAGDDPDVTHGAEIQVTVEWLPLPGVVITGGEGVGIVTRPGLPVPVGEAAINPGPRHLIEGGVLRELANHAGDRGLKVTVSVPSGNELAKKTMNPRLGIVGGISILGTTGIVKPFSRSAYRASIYVELKVAAHSGVERAILTTGSRSGRYALSYYGIQTELGCVQVGDYIGYALRQVRRLGFSRTVISGMIGKISKLAQGRMLTHVSEGGIDLNFLAEMIHKSGAGGNWEDRIRQANTARHVQVMLRKAGLTCLEDELAQMAARQAFEFAGGAFDVEVLLWDIGGDLLGYGCRDRDR